jgi:hypothetical protein
VRLVRRPSLNPPESAISSSYHSDSVYLKQYYFHCALLRESRNGYMYLRLTASVFRDGTTHAESQQSFRKGGQAFC